MQIEIKDMFEADFQAMVEECKKELEKCTIAARIHSEDTAKEKAEEFYASVLTNGIETPEHIFKAIHIPDQPEAVGHLWLKQRKKNKYFIMWVYVAPKYRERGIATAAFDWIDTFAEENDIHDIQLHVFASSQEAKRLYSKIGFVETGCSMLKSYRN